MVFVLLAGYGDGLATALEYAIGLRSPWLVLLPIAAAGGLVYLWRSRQRISWATIRYLVIVAAVFVAGLALQLVVFGSVDLLGYLQLIVFVLALIMIRDLFAGMDARRVSDLLPSVAIVVYVFLCAYVIVAWLIWQATGVDTSVIKLILGQSYVNEYYGLRIAGWGHEPAWSGMGIFASFACVYYLAPRWRYVALVLMILAAIAVQAGTLYILTAIAAAVTVVRRPVRENLGRTVVVAVAAVVLLFTLGLGRINGFLGGDDPSANLRTATGTVAAQVALAAAPWGVGYGNIGEGAVRLLGADPADPLIQRVTIFNSDVLVLNLLAQFGVFGLVLLAFIWRVLGFGRLVLISAFLAWQAVLTGTLLVPALFVFAALAGLRRAGALARAGSDEPAAVALQPLRHLLRGPGTLRQRLGRVRAWWLGQPWLSAPVSSALWPGLGELQIGLRRRAAVLGLPSLAVAGGLLAWVLLSWTGVVAPASLLLSALILIGLAAWRVASVVGVWLRTRPTRNLRADPALAPVIALVLAIILAHGYAIELFARGTALAPSTFVGPTGYSLCAAQNTRCAFAGRRDVAFGAAGRFTYRAAVLNGIDCAVAVFGNPINGVPKACYSVASAPPGYVFCAAQNYRCDFADTRDVAFGAGGVLNYRYAVSGGVDCTAAVFGNIAPDVPKACYSVASEPPGYSYCAPQNERCQFEGVRDVAFGAGGAFSYRYAVSGGIDCTAAVFGTIAPNVPKACYSVDSAPRGYTLCAAQNEHCVFSGVRDVAFGAGGEFIFRYALVDGVDCTTAVFGNLAANVPKACYLIDSAPPGYAYCAPQNARCDFTGIRDVAFGAAGHFEFRYAVSGGIDCTAAVFGNLDAGIPKACYSVASEPAGYSYCAPQNEHCAFTGVKDVAFGAAGVYSYRYAQSAGIDCSAAVFGNLLPGVPKSCFTIDSAPPGYTICAAQNTRCDFTGVRDVAFGVAGQFEYRYAVIDGIDCSAAIFGNLLPGVPKACYTKPASP